jgi:MFS family permease
MAQLGIAALRHRDFRLYVASSFLWTLAMQVQATALAWHVYELTASAFMLGLVYFMEFMPAVILALPAGHAADRHDRRRIVLLGIGLELAAAAALVALSVSNAVSVPAILGVALTFGIGRAVANPAARALMPSLVPQEDLPGGVAWASFAWQGAVVVGPGLGGLLYALGPAYAYETTAAALVAALAATILMRGRPVAPPPPGEPAAGGLADLLAGLTLIRRNKLLLGAISLDLFAVLFSGATALLPVFAKDILLVDADWGGLLRTFQAAGGALMAALLALLPLRRHVGLRLFVAVGVFGLAALVFGASKDYWLSAAAVFLLGAADMVSIFVRGTLVPLATPDALRGRVIAVEAVFIGASNELGGFVAGSAAALLGPVAAVLAGGSLTLAVTVVWARLFPALRRIDRFEELAPL